MRRSPESIQHEVVQKIQDRLERIGHGFSFDIVEGGLRRDGEWWYVPVLAKDRHGRTPPHDFLVNAYANIEDRLYVDEKINVLFVPLGSESPDAKAS